MKHAFDPQHLHIASFAQAMGHQTGQEPLFRFARLMEQSLEQDGHSVVRYTVQGSLRPDAAGQDEPWLHLSAQASLSLVCQRCLGPVQEAVTFARDFRFVATEALAEVEDEESEEDVLVLSKSFDLLELIEDELLMATPLVAKHAVCPSPVRMQAADADFEGAQPDKPNPFAVLQQLRKKDGTGGSGE